MDEKPRCFVMQPFDGGVFDKRYDDVFAPAISDAGFEPYRVDRDPAVSIPIEQIEEGIRDSEACLAEISLDNPNVWFELGFAIALKKDVVLVCSLSDRTTKFPFDIQHRSIITYKPESSRDFNALRESITKKLTAVLRKAETIETLQSSPIAETEGLEPYEIATLVVVAEGDLNENPPGVWSVKQDMGRAGFKEVAAVLALRSLEWKGYVSRDVGTDFNGETYTGFRLTNLGLSWMLNNRDHLSIRKVKKDYDDFEPPPFDDEP